MVKLHVVLHSIRVYRCTTDSMFYRVLELKVLQGLRPRYSQACWGPRHHKNLSGFAVWGFII